MNTNTQKKNRKNNNGNKYITVKRTKYLALLNKMKPNVNNNNNSNKAKKRVTPRKNVSRPVMRRRDGIMGDPYAICRLTPFQSKGIGNGIPDGSDARKILIDHRMNNVLTFGTTGSFDILVTPALPSSVWIRSGVGDSTFKINGATHSYNVVDRQFGIPMIQPEWRNLPVQLHNAEGVFDDAGSLYGANKCRLVTVGWSITYIGTDYQNSGAMTIQTYALAANDSQPNQNTFAVFNSQGPTNKNWNEGQLQLRYLGSDPFQNLSTRSLETKTIPLRKGANGVLRHTANEYEWTPITPNLTFLTNSATEKQSCLMIIENGTSEQVVGHWPHVASYDDGWSSTLIKISGGADGASFMLDTLYCVEYIPAMNNESYSLAKGSGPEKATLIKSVNDVAKKLPVSFVGSAIEGVKTAASLGLTFGSLVA